MASSDLLYKVVAATKDFDKPIGTSKKLVDDLGKSDLGKLDKSVKGVSATLASLTSMAGRAALGIGKLGVGGVAKGIGGVAKGITTVTSGLGSALSGAIVSGNIADTLGNSIGTTILTAVGGGLGSVVPGMGTLVGGSIGNVMGKVLDATVGQAINNAKEDMKSNENLRFTLQGKGFNVEESMVKVEKMKETMALGFNMAGSTFDDGFKAILDKGFDVNTSLALFDAANKLAASTDGNLIDAADKIAMAMRGKDKAALSFGLNINDAKGGVVKFEERFKRLQTLFKNNQLAANEMDRNPLKVADNTFQESLGNMGAVIMKAMQPVTTYFGNFFTGLLTPEYQKSLTDFTQQIVDAVSVGADALKQSGLSLFEYFHQGFFKDIDFSGMFGGLTDIFMSFVSTLADVLSIATKDLGETITSAISAATGSALKTNEGMVAEMVAGKTPAQRKQMAAELRAKAEAKSKSGFVDNINPFNNDVENWNIQAGIIDGTYKKRTYTDALATGAGQLARGVQDTYAATNFQAAVDFTGKKMAANGYAGGPAETGRVAKEQARNEAANYSGPVKEPEGLKQDDGGDKAVKYMEAENKRNGIQVKNVVTIQNNVNPNSGRG